MKLTVDTNDFARELALLEKIVNHKATILVLGNVLIQAASGAMMLSATDLEIGLVGACAADVSEPGSVTLPAKKLMELVRAQSDETLTLATGPKGSVMFTSGGFASKLQSLPVADFPSIPSMVHEDAITLPRAPFRNMLAQVRYAIAEKDNRYFMNGALLVLDNNTMRLVATDSKRMSISTAPRVGAAEESVLIPQPTLDELVALLAETATTDVTFSRTERHLFFELDGRLLVSRQVDGKFPKYERIIPKDNTFVMTLGRLALVPVVKRAMLINEVITVTLSAEALTVSALHAAVGEASESVAATYDGPPMTMSYNGQFLLDYLAQAVNPQVSLQVKDKSTAAIFTDDAYIGVIMGMQ